MLNKQLLLAHNAANSKLCLELIFMLNKELLLPPPLTNSNQPPFLRGQYVQLRRVDIVLDVSTTANLSRARYYYDPYIIPQDVFSGDKTTVQSGPYMPNVNMIQELNNISGYYIPQNSYIIGYVKISGSHDTLIDITTTLPSGYTFGSYCAHQQGINTLYAIGATELPQYVDEMVPASEIYINLS